MTDSPLKAWLERDGALLRLRLARPKANIVDAAMIGALAQAFAAHRDNAGLLAAQILALTDADLAARVAAFRARQTAGVAEIPKPE